MFIGKTTFLSSLALRIDPIRMQVSGELLLNGKTYSKHTLKSMSGYVMQDDLTHSHLTVSETLSYTASLRLSRNSTSAERKERVEHVIKLMGLSHCRDVIIGDTRHKGISGGERKRLCIAMELLMKPALLFLDEPTSG
jgi:ATP-binding cassette subfamily G (WHITE) protein 2